MPTVSVKSFHVVFAKGILGSIPLTIIFFFFFSLSPVLKTNVLKQRVWKPVPPMSLQPLQRLTITKTIHSKKREEHALVLR